MCSLAYIRIAALTQQRTIGMADSKLYEVEKILGKKVLPSRRVLYRVRWKGFSTDHDSWEPYSNLEACRPLINLFNHNLEANNLEVSKSTQSKSRTPDENPGTKESPKRKTAGNYLASILSKAKGNLHRSGGKKLSSSGIQKSRKSKSLGGLEQKGGNVKTKRQSLPEATDTDSHGIGMKKLVVTSPEKVSNSTKPIKQRNRKRKLIVKTANENSNKEADKKKVKKSKTVSGENKEPTHSVGSTIVVASSSDEEVEESENEDSDEDVLYSLNPECDIVSVDSVSSSDDYQNMRKNLKSNRKGSGAKSVISVEDANKTGAEDGMKKSGGMKKKRMSLLDSKKQSKDWVTKSGVLRSVSPPPIFTTVKHLLNRPDTQDPSKPSGNSLPDPVSPEASETYLADVPTSYLVPAEEPAGNEQPLSPGCLSYKSLLDSLPDQLHPAHKGGKKTKGDNSSGHGSSTGSSSVSLVGASFTSTLGREPVERRTSVRSTECAFRYKQIVVKKCFRYTQIWLNTQTVMKNALNPQVIQEVVSALSSAKYDDSHLVLFSSLGHCFCSGTDLHFLVSGDRKMAARQMADAIRDLTKTFITFPKPIIAAVSGAAVGLGVSLLALCDVVYASDKASFHLPYSQLSQTPEGCSSFTLPLNLGLASANELLYGGRKITAMEAYQLGLVSQVFWPTLMMQEVIPRAQNMASCSAKALEATKLLVRSHHRTKMELTNETECNLLLERWLSVDCQRAIEAYLGNEKNLTF